MYKFDRNILTTKLTPKHLDPKNLIFSVFTSDDIRNLSVKKIITPESFNAIGHPLIGGLYDTAFGPMLDGYDVCSTCGGTMTSCPGHFGHIELPVPVVNPLFYKALHTLFKLSCLNCFTLQIPGYAKLLLVAKVRLIQDGLSSYIEELVQEVSMAMVKKKKDNESTIHISDVIENYIQNVYNKQRFRANQSSNKLDFGTKNGIVQLHTSIDNFLKQQVSGGKCISCNEKISRLYILKNKIMTIKHLKPEAENSTRIVHKGQTIFIMPDQSKEYMRKLWQNEKDILKVLMPCLNDISIENPTDVFFFNVIPVVPPIVRPINILNNQIIEHPQSQIYKSIFLNSMTLRNIIQVIKDGDTSNLPDAGKAVFNNTKGISAIEKLHNSWEILQAHVDHLIDRDLNKTADSFLCQGLKQVIEKKEGIIRMHMMGKRVNYAARSVITPDPYLNIDEIGVPEHFATRLTYPVPVTPWNAVELRQLILNGPDEHPGAVMIQSEDGTITRLSRNYTQRAGLAKRLLTMTEKANQFYHGVKIVHRHLQNEDILLVNRQPTLHKPSIMAHKARILKGEKTLRLHYANCKSYNADFDGDEMNVHFPQNELARSEGYYIANVSNQYLVPKDGTPLSGLIQDHMIGGVKLTLRGTFFNKDDYMQLVFSALSMIQGNITLLPPAILKPVPLWSGKQIISTIIMNIIPRNMSLINLNATAKIGANEWQRKKSRPWKCGTEFKNPNDMSEAEIVIRNGELLCGVLDKKHYGATPFGFIHCVFELYGGGTSSKLLSAFGKVFQAYLQMIGFTLGIEDILVKTKADLKRSVIINECRQIGEDIHRSILELPQDTPKEVVKSKMEEAYSQNPKFRAQVDRKYKGALDEYTNRINKVCLPSNLIKTFPHNNLQLMVQSGAKGSTVNTMQISCLLGQIELEGKRPPLMISGKSLPSFLPYDPTPRAGGFIDGRFMTGLQPQEFFFHCMAGREGLIDTAVKTSRSGYLQRCLIKHLEGLTINYDATVRDSDGSLIQFYYGEDGLDIPKSRFLNEEHFGFLVDNRNAIANPELMKHLKKSSDTQELVKHAKRLRKWTKKNGDPLGKLRVSEFAKFSAENSDSYSTKKKAIDIQCGRSKASLSLMKKWIRMDAESKQSYRQKCARCPEPLIAKHRHDMNFGLLPEKLEQLLESYTSRRMPSATGVGKDEIRDVLSAKVMNSFCAPGEPVGLLGEMNVTLGIPRLREILMMASKNIKTPSMEIPFNKSIKNPKGQSRKLCMRLTKCHASNIFKHIEVTRRVVYDTQHMMLYTIRVVYLPHWCYKNEFIVKPEEAIVKTETVFFKEMFKEMKRMIRKTGTQLFFQDERSKTKEENLKLDEEEVTEHSEPKSSKRFELGEALESSDEEEIAEDADATLSRRVTRHQENREYEDPEAEEEEVEEVHDDEEIEPNNRDVNEDEGFDPQMNLDILEHMKYDERRKFVLTKYRDATAYDYDTKNHEWCELTFAIPIEMGKFDVPVILRKVANKTVFWETPLIKRAFIFQNQKDETILKTDGINIAEMFKYYKVLDLHRLYTNDIYAVSQTYGIEAAYRVIIKEVQDVFKMYGITVDTRHLSLIADYMTFEGTYQSLNRKSMEDSPSPLQQISFESSLNFLKNATIQGKCDNLSSPSSRLMLGQPCKSGTGAFSLLIDIQQQINQCYTQRGVIVS